MFVHNKIINYFHYVMLLSSEIHKALHHHFPFKLWKSGMFPPLLPACDAVRVPRMKACAVKKKPFRFCFAANFPHNKTEMNKKVNCCLGNTFEAFSHAPIFGCLHEVENPLFAQISFRNFPLLLFHHDEKSISSLCVALVFLYGSSALSFPPEQ